MDRRILRVGQHTSLRGRAYECALLDDFAEAIRRNESRSLVVRGEAGIGKTALLEYLINSAKDLTVVRTIGVEVEMELAYGGLHRLFGPLLDRLESLPEPQRNALGTGFGLTAGPPPDRFLMCLAALGLLSEAAEARPLLCVVDDAQWLDRASLLTLAFVARRLLAEPIGIVFAARHPGEELSGLPDLEVSGLRDGDARALLGSALRYALDGRVRDRVIAETHGNPLALLELPRSMQLTGGSGLTEAPELTQRLEESFIRRFSVLPEDTRQLMVLASAEPIGDPFLLWRAAGRLGISPDAAEPAEADDLMVIRERVTFRHPLVRSTVYRSASPEERRAVHSALAEATDREIDPDRRIWHRAASAERPDEDIASELERSAERAGARGGVAAVAALLRRSVELTADHAQRPARARAAAQANLQAGAFDEARRLLSSAEAGPLDGIERARIDLLRGQIEFASSLGGEAPTLLLRAARKFDSVDADLARETYLHAWVAASFAGRFAGPGILQEISHTGASGPQADAAMRPTDLLLRTFSTLVSQGRAAAAPTLGSSARLFAEGEIAIADGLRWGWLAATAAIMLWDEAGWSDVIDRQLHSVREAGLLNHLPVYLTSMALVATWRGDFGTAESLIAEADGLAELTGTRHRNGAVVLAGFRGDKSEVARLFTIQTTDASAAGHGLGLQFCQWASAVLYNGLGHYEDAFADARWAAEEAPELFISGWALVELIEAASKLGQTRLAFEVLERLVDATGIGDSDWGLGVLARSRALLSEGPVAESFYREAIERLNRTRVRPEIARARLVYGEWLRRQDRRGDARVELQMADQQFTTMGMRAFADRARRERQAGGEKIYKPRVETTPDLTAQERQIAELACEGLSNPEIGARLFLSPRTIEWHLRKVFTKLGIRTRRQLRDALS
jgi:DNA-binding CsgD family transcriptional regulator